MTRNCCRKKLVHARHFLTSYIHQLLFFVVYFITGINYFKCNTAPKKGKKEMIFGAEAILFFFPPQNAPPPPYYFFTCYLFSSPLFSRNQIPDIKMAVFINFHQKGTADVHQQQTKKGARKSAGKRQQLRSINYID